MIDLYRQNNELQESGERLPCATCVNGDTADVCRPQRLWPNTRKSLGNGVGRQ